MVGNMIKDMRNPFRSKAENKMKKNEIYFTKIKGVRNLFRLKKQNETIKDRVMRDIINLFEHEVDKICKQVRLHNVWSNSYIGLKSNGVFMSWIILDLNKIRSHLKDIINDLKNFDTWKIQLTISINFVSFKANDKERVMHSKSDSIEFMIYDTADDVIKELFESLLNRLEWKHKWELVILSSIGLIYCIKSISKLTQIKVDNK